jgi:asparagine synthase (glutamine-hydrolysing)
VVEFAWQLPVQARVSQGRTKRLLRQVLYRHVPPALIERPKQGFSLPVGAWLRGPLRDWAEVLLAPALLDRQGLLSTATVRSAWADHLSGRSDRAHALWTVLMLQAWLAQQEAA